jgi:hypothetical protein
MECTTVDDVLRELAKVVARSIGDDDRVGLFAALYRQVTAEVSRHIAEGNFDDGDRMSRFDAHFGNRYFEALEAWRTGRVGVPACWDEAFATSTEGKVLIVQHLALGINAHITLDLAVAAARTEPGPGIASLRRDFFAVNAILISVVEILQDAVADLSPGMRMADRLGWRADEAMLGFGIRRSRARAWAGARVLAAAEPGSWDGVLAEMDRRAADQARIIRHLGGWRRHVVGLLGWREMRDVAAAIRHLDGALARTQPN